MATKTTVTDPKLNTEFTLHTSITAAKREYSAAQNKAYNVGIWEVKGGFIAVPQGHPLTKGWATKVAENRMGKWINY